MENGNRQLADRLRHTLDDEVATLSPDTRYRLQQLRSTALATPSARTNAWTLLPTSGALASTALLLIVAIRAISPPERVLPANLDWLSQGELQTAEFEIAEDLDFYQWLVTRDAG